MFSVLFEVLPKPDQWDAYLGNARMLRPELEQVEGFVDNIRYKSLQRDGWILSLSNWRDEKAVVRWRTRQHHHDVQERGRSQILRDYRLHVGEIIADNQLPSGMELKTQRTDETEVGRGTMVTIITATRPDDHAAHATADAQHLGLDVYANNMLVDWDVYEAVLTPGDLVLMLVWKSSKAMESFETVDRARLHSVHRIRHIRVIRDYGMFDRREAPQYYPDIPKSV